MPEPLNIPAAWRGAELLQRADWRHTFEPPEFAELDAALDAVQGLALEEISAANFSLPTLSSK